MLHARVRRLTASIALLAMLLAALAPTITHALASAGVLAPSLLEVCTVGGPRTLAPATDLALAAQATDAPQTTVFQDHCPFCLPIMDRLGPPPAASVHFFDAESGLAPPDAQALFFRSHLAAAPWPRGPPSHS